MLKLRDYQSKALKAIGDALAEGYRRVLVAHPTGAGKTVTFAHLIAERPWRSIVLCHRDELIQQTVAKLNAVAPELEVGVVKAEQNDVNATVVVASIQTLSRDSRLRQIQHGVFRTIVVDEAHHATAPSWVKVLKHLGSFSGDAPLTVGFTATPMRGDGGGLGSVWQKCVHRVSILDLVERGYLVPVVGQTIGTDADFSRVRVRGGDFADESLGTELMSSGAIDQIAGGYVEFAADRKGVAFTPTVETAVALAEALTVRGIRAETVTGAMPMEDRRAVLGRLHTGATQVVTNCAVLTEGFDEPSINCILIGRPTKSAVLYVQMVGRGTRLYPGKEDLLVLDAAGATGRHELVTAVNLGIAVPRGKLGEPTEPGPGWLCALCGIRCDVSEHYCALCRRPLPFEAIEAGTPTHPNCRANKTARVDLFGSKLRWLAVENGFCLSTGDQTLVLVPRGEDTWALVAVASGKRPEVLYDNLPFGYVQGAGEDLARDSGALVKRNARWLREPATAAQRSRLIREGFPAHKIGLVRTRGEAADLITRLIARRVLRRMENHR